MSLHHFEPYELPFHSAITPHYSALLPITPHYFMDSNPPYPWIFLGDLGVIVVNTART